MSPENPFGRAPELAEAGKPAMKKERYRPLPEHTVEELYKNEKIKLPFDPKDLVCFLDREQGTLELRTVPYHHRSADLGVTTIVKEKTTHGINVYSQFDLKGTGFVFPEEHESKRQGVMRGDMREAGEVHFFADSKETPWGYDTLGLMDERMAMKALEAIIFFSDKGLRTEGIAGIYRLKEFVSGGKTITLRNFIRQEVRGLRATAQEAASEKEKLHLLEQAKDLEDFQPVVVVRLMRSVFRLRDVLDAPTRDRASMIEEACDALNHEAVALDLPERFDSSITEGRKAWLERVAEHLGHGLGVIQGEGMFHGYLHMGNLTLAGEIVDMDSVESAMDMENAFRRAMPEWSGLPASAVKDMRDLCFSFRMVCKQIPEDGPAGLVIDRSAVAKAMKRGYAEGLPEKTPWDQSGFLKARLVEMFGAMVDKLVVQGKRVAPILADFEAVQES